MDGHIARLWGGSLGSRNCDGTAKPFFTHGEYRADAHRLGYVLATNGGYSPNVKVAQLSEVNRLVAGSLLA